MAKILFIFNFKTLKNATILLLGGISMSCADMSWIRVLPTDLDPTKAVIPIGLYTRPITNKSAMGAKDHELEIYEWIHLTSDKRFVKKYLSKEKREGKQFIKQKLGHGFYEKNGSWILLGTEILKSKDCEIPSTISIPYQFKSDPCLEIPFREMEFNHKLLYHYDSKDLSIAHLQYESGYEEANFGIAWEVKKAYLEDVLFKKIRAKYAKKEFQPHVYYYGRLD
ncbi:hypothetical protein EHQ58_11360 [Leptospira ognonensis]|uniref:Lipoprotein n=1 Tax=Leptospira ognonensis TaxID=2484945 RepID=A0A4R9JZ82_9LEPT|nr:hypothetical protein [Leptospira ognonensis]TGL57989.1 hypothetical protein EHQ58_11360 [Leptospira ognonensis]